MKTAINRLSVDGGFVCSLRRNFSGRRGGRTDTDMTPALLPRVATLCRRLEFYLFQRGNTLCDGVQPQGLDSFVDNYALPFHIAGNAAEQSAHIVDGA